MSTDVKNSPKNQLMPERNTPQGQTNNTLGTDKRIMHCNYPMDTYREHLFFSISYYRFASYCGMDRKSQ